MFQRLSLDFRSFDFTPFSSELATTTLRLLDPWRALDLRLRRYQDFESFGKNFGLSFSGPFRPRKLDVIDHSVRRNLGIYPTSCRVPWT